MNIVILGLSITSSWGNGHATTYRALVRELHRRGHKILFLERDRLWYAEHRDFVRSDVCTIELYAELTELYQRYAAEVEQADCVIVGSYVPDGAAVAQWATNVSEGVVAFYDIDTPITLDALAAGFCEYLAAENIPDFDLYLSFTGGPSLQLLESEYEARRAVFFPCAVDTNIYRPSERAKRWDLGYLGTYSSDRQKALDALMLQPAMRYPDGSFVVAGSMYPPLVTWPDNVERIDHLPPARHPDFYNSQRCTLNLTREAMKRMGYSPSVRLFEAAACGVPIISDWWEGLDRLFHPDAEILIAETGEDTLRYLTEIPEETLKLIGRRARQRVLEEHTAGHRAEELERLVFAVAEEKGLAV